MESTDIEKEHKLGYDESSDKSNNPFLNRTPIITVYERVKMIIMTILLVPIIRILLLIVVSLVAIIYSTIIMLGVQTRNRKGEHVPLPKWRLVLATPLLYLYRISLFIMGFYWISVKRPSREIRKSQPEAKIIIANHSTFIDGPYFSSQLFATSVMKKEVSSAPILKYLLIPFQPITVDRSNGPDGFQAALSEITRRANNTSYPPILIFPEGTVSNQFSLTMFKRGAFTPGLPVQPVVLRYPFSHFDLSWGPMTSTLSQAWRMLCQVYNRMEVEYLPVYIPNDVEKSNPAVFAENVRLTMAKVMGAQITNHDLSDVMLLRRASISSRQYLARHVIPKVEMNVLKHVCDLNYDNVEALLEKFRNVDAGDTGEINYTQFITVLESDAESRYSFPFSLSIHSHTNTHETTKPLLYSMKVLNVAPCYLLPLSQYI
jgi:lysophosphatidylcholine acyltransferase/lyso-PAF acetyltransferase